MQALSISNLTKTYQNGVSALKGINFAVNQGDFFALLGPNGAGKSTTIGIITSLIKKTSGRITIFDHDIDQDFSIAKTYLGLVPQEFNFNIFEKTIQILTYQAGYYGLKRKDAYLQAKRYLKQLNLWDKRDANANSLSGGMKRRLMIARALLHEPQLLILDEPTAGVDIEVRRAMWSFIREINSKGTTIILTTHYLEEAESLCKNIAIIDRGVIIENTAMKTLLKKLHIETFILYLTKSLSFAPELPNHNCRLVDDTTLEIDLHKDQSLNDLFGVLSQHQIEIASMRNKTNRLEELFLGMITKND